MANPLVLLLLTWTILQAVGVSHGADSCVAVRGCDNANNIRTLEAKVDEKLREQQAVIGKLQAALDKMSKENAGKI